MTLLMIAIEIGRISSAASVIHTLILSIITSTPMSVVQDVMSWVTLWLIPICRVSTSLVILERISPWVLLSKYFMGILLIFWEMSFLRLYVTSFDIPVIINPWIKDSRALTRYRQRHAKRI